MSVSKACCYRTEHRKFGIDSTGAASDQASADQMLDLIRSTTRDSNLINLCLFLFPALTPWWPWELTWEIQQAYTGQVVNRGEMLFCSRSWLQSALTVICAPANWSKCSELWQEADKHHKEWALVFMVHKHRVTQPNGWIILVYPKITEHSLTLLRLRVYNLVAINYPSDFQSIQQSHWWDLDLKKLQMKYIHKTTEVLVERWRDKWNLEKYKDEMWTF